MHAGIKEVFKHKRDFSYSGYKILHSGDEDGINHHTTIRTSLIEPS